MEVGFEQQYHKGQHVNALAQSWQRMHKYAWFATLKRGGIGWSKAKYIEEGLNMYAQLMAERMMSREDAVQVSLKVTKWLSATMYAETKHILTTKGCNGREMRVLYSTFHGDLYASMAHKDEVGYNEVEDRDELSYWLAIVHDKLPARQAEMLSMYIEMDQPPYAVMAPKLGVTAAAVGSTLIKAQKNMTKIRQEMRDNAKTMDTWEANRRGAGERRQVRSAALV